MGCGNSNAAQVAPTQKTKEADQKASGDAKQKKPESQKEKQNGENLKNQDSSNSKAIDQHAQLMGNVIPKGFDIEQSQNNRQDTIDSVDDQDQITQKKDTPHSTTSGTTVSTAAGANGTSTAGPSKFKPESEGKELEGGSQSPQLEQKQRQQVQKVGKKIRGGEDTDEIYENITQIQKTIKHDDLVLIISSLKSHFVFFALSEEELGYIVEKMFYCEVVEGDYVFKEGDKASSYFIIASGEVSIEIGEVSKKSLKSGQAFGQLALLYNAPRSAGVRAKSRLGLWGIDRQTFRQTIEDIVLKDYQINRKFMQSVSFFSFMTNEQKDAIGHSLITVKYTQGQVIVNEGDRADSFYMIKDGVVIVEKGGAQIRKLNQGDSFGEQALYQSSTRGCTVRAEGEVQCLSLGRENLIKVLGNQIQKIIYNNLQKWAFSKSGLLSQLTKIQIEKISNVSKINSYPAGQVLYEKGSNPNKLIIVLEGELSESKGDVVATQGTIFGDEYLKADKQNVTLKDDIIMKKDGVLSVISFNNLINIVGADIEIAIKNNQNSHEKKMAKIEVKSDYSHIQLEKLLFIQSLGHGQFGSVFLVQNQDNQQMYGLKSVSKAQIIDQNLEKHQVQQKKVLEAVNFPFIYHFYRTFRDHMSVYYLVEFINGMELFDVIREIGLLTTYESQYYVGTMILCLEYLHSRSIIYRDLKPENIMVNQYGIMQLIDMGTAKDLSTAQTPGRTFTIIGTPHYMAPEIIQGKGYSYAVDLWSVGICLYEFMCGGVPYAEDLDDPYDIYEEIMKNDITYPSGFKDRRAKKLIETLLHQVPELRLNGSYAALKAHSWFDNFDWDKLYNKELKPPFTPPAEKIFKATEIENIAQLNIPVTDEIKKEQAANKLNQATQTSKDPNWDVNF